VASLQDILLADDMRRRVVDDAARLVEDEVRSKRGVSGLAIKAGFKAFRKVRPGALPMAVNNLLDPFARAADPFYQEHLESGRTGSVSQTFLPRADAVAEALLSITDERARRFDSGLIKKTYYKLRPLGKRNTVEAVPGICRLIDKYV